MKKIEISREKHIKQVNIRQEKLWKVTQKVHNFRYIYDQTVGKGTYDVITFCSGFFIRWTRYISFCRTSVQER